MDKKQFMSRLSQVTDQSTNVGFLTGGKKFHGLLEENRFRLKRDTSMGVFKIKGEVTTKPPDVIVEVEYETGFMLNLMLNVFFIMGIFFLIDTIRYGQLDIRYYPFIILLGLLVFVGFDFKRRSEIDKIKKLLRSSVEQDAR